MCGILGILSLDGRPVTLEELSTGANKLIHRGPDAQTYWIEQNQRIGFAHTRLSIIDLSEDGNQPFTNEDGSVHTVINGEIYNYQSLKARLATQGHSFKGHSDCETIPHLYEEYGLSMFDHLDGMFALALWDGNRLILARDPFGKKPLFYAHVPNKFFIFASEIKAILPFLKSNALNRDNFLNYLSCGYTLGEETIFEAIHHVPPGSFLEFTFQSEKIERTQYWHWPTRTSSEERTDAEWIQCFRENLLTAVEKRLMSDVPLGAFLSGGLDSSAIVALMHTISPDIERHTFSIHFQEDSYDTYDHIEPMVKIFGIHHHRIPFLKSDFLTWFDPAMQSNDGLSADLSLIPMHKLSAEAGRELRVVLTGDGADELLGGYETYKATRLAHRIGCFREPLGRCLKALAGFVPAKGSRNKLNSSVVLQQLGKGLSQRSIGLTHARWRQIFSYSEVEELLNPEFKTWLPRQDLPEADYIESLWAKLSGDNILHQSQALDIQTWMLHSILAKVDRTTMAHSLEARSPFYDKALAQLAAQLPLHIRTRKPKWILRKAVEDLLPPTVTWQKKSGFNTPLSRWFLQDPQIRQLAEHWLFSREALSHQLFDKQQIQRLWQQHHHLDCHFKLWNIMVFNAWAKAYAIEPSFLETSRAKVSV
jgi:asparagine synthase (glutamine-hydrolysing)